MDGPSPVPAARNAAGPLFAYRARIAGGKLRPDPAQALAAEKLQDLWRRTRGYDPHHAPSNVGAPEEGGFLSRFFRHKPVDEAPGDVPGGLYLVGEVGQGKSMLMDLFFDTADVPRKRRLHFHEFMRDAHARVHAWRRTHPVGADPIPLLANALADEAALLCFDEFQVHDVTDAMILGRVFEALFARGTVVVATSNTAPDDLFRGQPGHDAFLPFIALIKRRLDVLHLHGQGDYRRERVRGMPTWHCPDDGRARRALDAAFRELAGVPRGEPAMLAVLGHRVSIPQVSGCVARADFEALCGRPLGPADYLALATHYRTLVLEGVPRLGPENFDRAHRFITLVDALYEHRCKLVASAAAQPDALYEGGGGAHMFQRTASRLAEMQSQEYLALPHLT